MTKFYSVYLKLIFITLLLLKINNLSGQTWENLGTISVNGENVSAINAIEGFNNAVYLCTNKGLFASMDDGSTFTNLSFSSGITQGKGINCIYRDELNGDLYIGDNEAVYKSTDAGSTWQTTALTAIDRVNDIGKGVNNIVVAYGSTNLTGGVYYSTDGLSTATQSTSIPDLQMLDFQTYNGAVFLAGKDAVYVSVNDGIDWAVSGTGHPTGGKYIKLAVDNTSIFAADVFGNGLYKSTDNGLTWNNTDPTTFDGFCQVFDVTEANGTVMAVMDGSVCVDGAPIKFSQDNGVSWSNGMFNLSGTFYPQLGRNSSGSCLFVFGGGILYRICNLTLSNNQFVFQMPHYYPNPTQGIINFDGITNASVDIYNLQGQHIKNFKNVDRTIDLSNFNSGIYFLNLEFNQRVSRFKIIKN